MVADSVRFSTKTIMSSTNRDIFILPFQSYAFCFSCLEELARTSSAMMNRRSKNRRSCLAPNLKGKAFSDRYPTTDPRSSNNTKQDKSIHKKGKGKRKKENTPTRIIIELLKTKDKDKILKATQEKKTSHL